MMIGKSLEVASGTLLVCEFGPKNINSKIQNHDFYAVEETIRQRSPHLCRMKAN